MKPSTYRRRGYLCGVLSACVLALGTGGCGGDEDDSGGSNSGGAAKKAQAVERAFLTTMVPHHESAIEMARIAREKGDAPFVTQLAGDILRTQKREIARMKEIHQRLLGDELKPDPAGHDRLGLSAAEAGMTHDAQTNEALRTAKPFDRAFVDEMAGHHAGAIEMANVVLKTTKDAQLRTLAHEIVSTQKHEIEQMNAFRTEEFGAPVPTGGGHGEKGRESEKHGAGHGG